jgi:hypothetical protein
MQSDDFVERLRRYDQVGPKTIITEAADEIDRLREQLRLANIDNFNTTAEVERMRTERDAARREVCALRPSVCLGAQTAVEFANHRGWDCFDNDKTE